MPTSRKAKKKTTASEPKPIIGADRKFCFVISPIGAEGTEKHRKFKEVLEYIIKSAVKSSGYEIEVLRADDINRSGSFIKDILDSIYSSFIVIADLTEQNPNVFYKLGVRHALSPRTILIAQSLDEIPSDLREYRTTVYDTSAKGAAEFAQRIKKYLAEINKEPERPDNPVLDRIGNIVENRIALLETENQNLKNELTIILQRGTPKLEKKEGISINTRVRRITQLMNAEEQFLTGHFSRDKEQFSLPGKQGNFKLYFVQDGENIKEMWYLSIQSGEFDYLNDLADVRVLMENCIQQGGTWCKFIIATSMDLSNDHKNLVAVFNKMKEKLSPEFRKNFSLEIWDDKGLMKVEKELGLRYRMTKSNGEQENQDQSCPGVASLGGNRCRATWI